MPGSERITDRKVESEGFVGLYVEIAALASIVRRMETIAEVAADNHHSDIHPETDPGSERDITQERISFQLAAGAQGVILQEPYIAGVDKGGSMKYADYREPVFRVEFELESTGLVEISVFQGLGRPV